MSLVDTHQQGLHCMCYTDSIHNQSQGSRYDNYALSNRDHHREPLTDVLESLAKGYLWSQIEPASTILCACVVTYKPLFCNINPSISKRLSSILSFGKRSRSTSSGSDDTDRGRRLQYQWPYLRVAYTDNISRHAFEGHETCGSCCRDYASQDRL